MRFSFLDGALQHVHSAGDSQAVQAGLRGGGHREQHLPRVQDAGRARGAAPGLHPRGGPDAHARGRRAGRAAAAGRAAGAPVPRGRRTRHRLVTPPR